MALCHTSCHTVVILRCVCVFGGGGRVFIDMLGCKTCSPWFFCQDTGRFKIRRTLCRGHWEQSRVTKSFAILFLAAQLSFQLIQGFPCFFFFFKFHFQDFSFNIWIPNLSLLCIWFKACSYIWTTRCGTCLLESFWILALPFYHQIRGTSLEYTFLVFCFFGSQKQQLRKTRFFRHLNS